MVSFTTSVPTISVFFVFFRRWIDMQFVPGRFFVCLHDPHPCRGFVRLCALFFSLVSSIFLLVLAWQLDGRHTHKDREGGTRANCEPRLHYKD